MILKFGGRNFYCFKEDFEVDMRLNNNCPDSISNGNDFSQVMCIKGHNGAGKTNALKSLSFISAFAANSFEHKPEKVIGFETFFHNHDVTELFCEFRIDSIDYRYELIITKESVVKESLNYIANGKSIFIREFKELTFVSEEFSDLNSIPQLRSNASIFSTANQFEIESIEHFYAFFKIGIYSNVTNYGFREFENVTTISKFYKNNPDALQFISCLLKKYDTGIKEVKIDSHVNSDNEEVFMPTFFYDVDGEEKSLKYYNQSSGTKRLYMILAWFYIMTKEENKHFGFSSVVLMDELDLHLHSKILPELIDLFKKNPKSQLIFTSQNDDIMDDMGKYRTILVGKDENESFSYRLDELPSDLLRNGRPITPHYRKGNIGGVPNIGK